MKQDIFKGLPLYDEQAFNLLEDLYDENSDQILAALPWFVSELIIYLGFRKAMTFIYQNGGRKYYLNHERSRLSDKLGFDLSEQFYDRILALNDSSGNIEVPSPWGVSGRIRKALVISSYQNGMTREEIRETFGISPRLMTDLFRTPSGR